MLKRKNWLEVNAEKEKQKYLTKTAEYQTVLS